MSLESSVSLLTQQQEQILNIFNNKLNYWNDKIDSTGGILSGKLDFTNFASIDPITEKASFGLTELLDLVTIKSPTVDVDTVVSILGNQNGSAVLKLGVDNLYNPNLPFNHNSKIEFYSTNPDDKTTLLKDNDNSFNINHISQTGLFINCQTDVDITFNTKNINRLTISKLTGNVVINNSIDDINYKLQVTGDVSFTDTLRLKNKLTFNSTDPIINQTVDSSYIRLSGGNNWIDNGACILLTGKNEPNKPFHFEVTNTAIGTPSLIIDNQKTATFTGKVQAPVLELYSTTINNLNSLPQIVFKDSTQEANNRLWQIKSENSDLIIRTLDDDDNPGANVFRFIRSAGNNDLSKILIGQDDDIGFDVLTPAITINNLAVIGPRQTGWTNITNPSNLSKDFQTIASDNSALARVVRALISDLINHGLIGT